MKVVYVAGRFSAPDQWQRARNVRAAEAVAFAVAEVGAMPLNPLANTANFFGTLTDEFWYDGTLELMRRCDATILVPGWQGSKGVQREIDETFLWQMPLFERVDELKRWLGDGPVFDRAVRLLGPSAIVGRNEQYGEAPFHVGAKEHGEWTHFGAGATWEEAFATVKKVKLQKADQSFVFEEG